VYLKFDVRFHNELADIKREIQEWALQHGIRYTQKTIKYHHRVGFDQESDFTLFSLTWNPKDLDQRPWLQFQLVNVNNERY
jgi:hypothetical protein